MGEDRGYKCGSEVVDEVEGIGVGVRLWVRIEDIDVE